MSLTANGARELSMSKNSRFNHEAIQVWIEVIDDKIKYACDTADNLNRIFNIFEDSRVPKLRINDYIKNSLVDHYTQAGFKFVPAEEGDSREMFDYGIPNRLEW